jgi:hypothetical protein
MKDCTFSPQTLDYKGASKNQRLTHGDRNIDLYSMKKPGWFIERSKKSIETNERENQEEFSHIPKTNDAEVVKRKLEREKQNRKIDYIPGMDKVRDRMERAR